MIRHWFVRPNIDQRENPCPYCGHQLYTEFNEYGQQLMANGCDRCHACQIAYHYEEQPVVSGLERFTGFHYGQFAVMLQYSDFWRSAWLVMTCWLRTYGNSHIPFGCFYWTKWWLTLGRRLWQPLSDDPTDAA